MSGERMREAVLEGQAYLRSLSVDQIIEWLDEASHPWCDRSHPLQKRYGGQGLNFLLHWLRAAHLKSICDTALRGSRIALDRFIPTPSGQVACFPRGVVCHWIAGNVPTLGMLSLILGLVTKNGNILKLPSLHSNFVPDLVASLGEKVSTSGVEGERVIASIKTVSLDRTDRAAHEQLSMAADVRIAWGGGEAIEALVGLKRRLGCEDILFGPRTSFALIGRELLTSEDASKIARELVRDATLFDQKGCNAPHTLFVERGGVVAPRDFALLLAQEMERHCAALPDLSIGEGEVGSLLALRAEYDMCGEGFYSKGIGWSILFSEQQQGLAEPLGYRTLFVRTVDDVMESLESCTRHVQSVGMALSPTRYEECAYRFMERGVDRCPRIGQMGQFELPWDGLYVLDRLVRWSILN